MSRAEKIVKHMDVIALGKAKLRRLMDNPHPDYVRRRLICDQPCEERREDKVFGGHYCNRCGCNLADLANSESSKKCELGKW